MKWQWKQVLIIIMKMDKMNIFLDTYVKYMYVLMFDFHIWCGLAIEIDQHH